MRKRKTTTADLPLFRVLRDAYRKMLAAAHECKAEETDPGMMIAWHSVIDEIQRKFDAVGIRMDSLEKSR